MHTILRNKLLLVTYMLTILYALHYAIPLYATSSYLHIYFSASIVSAIYVFSSIAALLASLFLARSIKQFHTYPFIFTIVICEIFILYFFGSTSNQYLLPLFFIVHFVLQTLIWVCLNIYIESFSKHVGVGSIRGVFLTIFNLGILISPLIGGTILSQTSFKVLYAVSALTLLPFLFYLHKYLKHIKEPAYHEVNIFPAIKALMRNRNLRGAFIAQLMVNCFYAVMVIYSPLYLTSLGVPLTTYLSIILPLALIPLVLLPYELGFLADKKYGEKEMLIIGLLILVVTTFTCVLVESSDPRIWVAILFISRIGASFVETMAFSYYFKKIGPEDASLTALFSNAHGIATILVGSIGILVAPFLTDRPQLMFIILGCAILWSISSILPMRDTR